MFIFIIEQISLVRKAPIIMLGFLILKSCFALVNDRRVTQEMRIYGSHGLSNGIIINMKTKSGFWIFDVGRHFIRSS